MWQKASYILKNPRFHLINISVWLFFCVFGASRTYLTHNPGERSWLTIVAQDLAVWMPFGVFTIVLVLFAAHNPFRKHKLTIDVVRILMLWHLLMILYYPYGAWLQISFNPMWGWDDYWPRLKKSLYVFYFDYAFFAAITFVAYSLHYYREYTREQSRNQALARELVEAQLEALRSQLNPHFLFNTLNTVSGLIRVDKSAQALTAIAELSQLLRAVLSQQDGNLSTVSKELELVESYLKIQQLRFNDKLEVKLEVEAQAHPCLVPSLLLQPLIENAVTHGANQAQGEAVIVLKIHRQGERLVIRLINDIPASGYRSSGHGIGLKNTRERLAHIYQQDFRLELSLCNPQQVEICVDIPVREG